MTQEELVKKADLALADLNANGGLLNTEQSNRFIQKIIDQPTILSEARTVTMNAPQMQLNKIGFGQRILHAARQTDSGDGRAPTAAERSSPTTSKVNLDAKEVIAEVRVPYEVLEDNIERGNLTNTILDLIAERAALDLEELVLLGDTGSGDPYLALVDGILKKLTSNIVDATGLGITSDLFNNTIKALPTRYRRNKSLLRFFTSHDVEQDYRNAVSQRGSALGDAILTGSQALPVFSVPMKGAALMPEANLIMTNPLNMIVGIHRRIMIESDKDIRRREYIFVLTARLDVAIEEEEAAVKAINIGAA